MKSKKKQFISIQITEELAMRLNFFCDENGAFRSAVIRKAIEQYLDREQTK